MTSSPTAHTSIQTHTLTSTHARASTHTHTYKHTRARAHTHTHTHTHTHARTHTHTHQHTSTSTRTHKPVLDGSLHRFDLLSLQWEQLPLRGTPPSPRQMRTDTTQRSTHSTRKHARANIHTRARTHTHTHTHTQARAHTHTQRRPSSLPPPSLPIALELTGISLDLTGFSYSNFKAIF